MVKMTGPAWPGADDDPLALANDATSLRLALAATNQGLYELDVRSGVARVTPEYMSMLGEDPAATSFDLGSFGERVHPDDAERVAGVIDAYIRGDVDEFSEEFRLRRSSGEWFWVLSIGRVVERDADGRATRVFGSHTDITERKQAEQSLRDSERWLRESQRVARLGHYNFDIPGDRWEASEGLCAVFGMENECGSDLAGWLAIVHPDDREMMRAYFAEEVVGRHQPFDKEYRIVRANDGATRHVHGLGTLEYDADGAPMRMFGVIQDITERRAQEEALRQSQVLLESSLEAQTDTILLSIDGEYRYLYFNQAHARDMKSVYGVEVRLGMNILDAITSDADRVAAKENYDRALAGESHTNVRRYGDVEHAYYESFFNPIRDHDGRVIGATAMARDVTERQRNEDAIRNLNAELEDRVAERTRELHASNEDLRSSNEQLAELNRELVDANTRLEEATRAKDDFLAAMSHELRTPLNSVIGFSTILLQGLTGELSAEQTKQIRMINASGRHLLELINEVLDLAKVESSSSDPSFAPVDLGVALRDAFDSLRPVAEAKDVEMRWVAPDRIAPIVTDMLRVDQILLNLVGNAIKFTDVGRVTVTLTPDTGGITMDVADTGVGIAAADRELIFEAFYQVPPHSSAQSEGTGLGLALSRKLAESIGGRLDVVSEPGVGSTFTLWIPDRDVQGRGDPA